MTDASPAFVAVAGLYDARSRAGTRMLAGHTDATHAGLWGGKVQVYIFGVEQNAGSPFTLYAKTKEHPDLTFACVLEERHSNSGKRILFGVWNGTRIYIMENDVERRPKDCQPEYELCIRIDDYFKLGGLAPDVV